MTDPSYRLRQPSRSEFHDLRGLRYHVRTWGPAGARPLVLLHGWMDVSASFQFLVDALRAPRRVYAPDWRGFGLTEVPGHDCYWFADYIADLDALLDRLLPGEPVDLVAHSMGGNIACLYAGVRPGRVRRLVNLEGYGMRRARPEQAPARYAQWLDQLREPPRMRDYASREEVAARLMRNNPRLGAARARFLAEHWSRRRPDGRWELLGDPRHRIVNPTLYRVEEVLACWRAIEAPVLMLEAERTDQWHAFVDTAEYRDRLHAFRSLQRVDIEDAGHMLHHDQPERVARLIEDFLA
ncbi:MAG: alpha/beta hydrolase [Burkholderiales bacterium]|nr:MAG: alpha/beta hydrolase [Burkholderiales bacterium]